MAPEVITNSSGVTSACDIWSLGCTILELLTGQPPYFNLNQMTAMLKIACEGIPPLPEDISPELKDFLGFCFVRDPSKRKTASELMSHPWIIQVSPEVVQVFPAPSSRLENHVDTAAGGDRERGEAAHRTP